jgi:hypothetical protein
VRELKDYLIHVLTELKNNKNKDYFSIIVKISKLFKDPNLAYSKIEWWTSDSIEKLIYTTELTNKVLDVTSVEDFSDYLINEIGV